MRTGKVVGALGGLEGARENRDRARMIWMLAWPAILTFGLESIVGLVDMLMVGRLGAVAVAGVGIGTQVLHAVSVVMVAGATGTVALIARHIGARQHQAAERVLLQSLYAVGAAASVVAAPVAWWASDIVVVFGIEPTVAHEAARYVRVIMLGVPFAALFTVIAAGLRGAGDMRTPLALGAIVNVTNVGANYVFIFGKLGFPALGVAGAALASDIALGVGVLLGLGLLRRSSAVLRLSGPFKLDAATAWRVLRIGGPTAVEQLFIQVGFLLYMAIAASYGTAAVAAYVIGVRILALCFLPGFGFGAAAGTLVGQQLGAGDPDGAARSGWGATLLAIVFMSTGGLVIFLAAKDIALIFVSDPRVVDATESFIRTLAVAQPLMAIDFTLGGALRGAGDTRFPLLVVIVGFYGARLGFAFAAASLLSLSLSWVWAALLGDYVLRACLKAARFRSGRWKSIEV